MNTLSLAYKGYTARFFAAVTIVSLLLSAFPAARNCMQSIRILARQLRFCIRSAIRAHESAAIIQLIRRRLAR